MHLHSETLIGPTLLIRIDSENLDAGNAGEFKADIQPLLDSCDRVIIDMATLKFVDSSGLGALLSCLRTMNNRNGTLHLVGLAKPVRALFELVRMHRIFSLHDSVAAALVA